MRADFLPRIERRALWTTAAIAALALVWPRAGVPVMMGVFGGAILSGLSFWGVKRGVDGLMSGMSGGASVRGKTAQALTMLVGRYALLALIAYVMISRLRLSPLGLLLGASVIPIAAAIEVLAGFRTHGKV
jgi:hypothetical protein